MIIDNCCGQGNSPIEFCFKDSSSQTILTNSVSPSATFTLSASDTVTNNCCSDDCLDQVGCCSCEERKRLSCILQGDTIILTPIVTFENPICEDQTYNIKIYVNDILKSDETYDFGETPDDYSILLPTQGSFTIRLVATNCCGSCAYSKTVYAGYPLRIDRVGCRTLKFTDRFYYNLGNQAKIEILDLQLNPIDTFLFNDYNSTTDTTFLLPKDGSYIVVFSIVDSYGTVLYTKSFVIYEFCTVFACYEKAMRDLLCLNSCQETFEVRKQKDKLDILLTTTLAFLLSISKDYQAGYGVLFYNSSYLNTLKNNDAVLNQILSICGNCPTDHINSNSYLNTSLTSKGCGCS